MNEQDQGITTVRVRKRQRKRLMDLKYDLGFDSLDDVLEYLLDLQEKNKKHRGESP